MAIGNISIKNIITLPKKVESSFNSSKDRESHNFYHKEEEKKINIPDDLDELFDLLQKEVKKFQESDFAKRTGLIYLATKDDTKIFVVVKNLIGKVLRKIPPLEFLELTKTTSETKGRIINSVY